MIGTAMLPTPVLHPTREIGARAQAAHAVHAIRQSGDDTATQVLQHASIVNNYLSLTDLSDNREYEWRLPGKDGHVASGNGQWDQVAFAAYVARALANAAIVVFRRNDWHGAHDVARAAASATAACRRASRNRVTACVLPVLGDDHACATIEFLGRGLQSLATVCRHRNIGLVGSGSQVLPAPGGKLHALQRVCDAAAIDLVCATDMAAARDAEEENLAAPALADLAASACAYRLVLQAAAESTLDADGGVGRQLWCLKQVATMREWLVDDDDRHIREAVDHAWFRNGVRLEAELYPTSLDDTAPHYAQVPIPPWAQAT